ncbi:hypothetical protein ES703_118779 [subsurface metagenome]
MAEEVHLSSIPKVKIIKDGKEVDTSAIDDYDPFMTFLMQASIAANTAKIRKYYEDRASAGEIEPFELDITPEPQEVEPYYPSQSLYVENKGPGQIFVTINAQNRTPTPIPATREAYFPFETHVIERFYVWSAPGTVATATAILKY